MRATLQRLRAELAADRRSVEAHLDDLATLDVAAGGREQLALAALLLHHAYCGVESLLLRLVRFLGEGEPEGADWHRALLDASGLEIEGVRPAVFCAESLAPLQRLLAFRHFVRHAYTAELEAVRLTELQRDAATLRRSLVADLDRLDDFLKQVAAADED